MKILRHRWVLPAAMTLALGVVAAGQSRNQADVALQAAIRAETVDGNLADAIKRYADIAATYKSNRPVAASALVHMAECYQKLGDSEAKRVYERLIREFADQPEAVTTARARLGTDMLQGAPPVRGDRSLWSGIDVDLFGTISPDGRYLSYTDWVTTNNTMVHDFVTGKGRALTSNSASFGEFGYSGWSAISRDGRQIVYEWKPAGSRLDELRLSSLAGAGVPESRLLKQFAEGESPRPFDWSPDGRWIALLIERVDGASTIGVLSTDGTTLRRLRSVDWRGVNKMVFSPDGRSFAYDIATSDDGRRAEIRVMAVDATSDRLIVPNGVGNRVMAWAPDGHLVFSSERSGTLGLWIVPVADGHTTGAAKLAKDNLSSSWSLGLSRSGSLYIWKRGSAPYVKVAPIDWSTGRLQEDDNESFQQFIDSRGRPAWSRDGRFMVFISCGVSGGGPCALNVRDTTSGIVRGVPHQLRYLGFPQISPDGRWIVTDGRDTKGRGRLFLIDASTGATTRIAPDGENDPRYSEWSPAGRTIRYQELRGTDRVVVERSLQSDSTTEVLRLPKDLTNWIRISPDDKLFAYVHNDSVARTSTLFVRPIAGGEARPLVSGAYNTIAFLWTWLPDSSGILVERMQPDGRPEALWQVPLSGQPRKLDIDISQWQDGGVFSIHPDGRHLAFAAFAGNPGAEVWALDNFLPSPSGKESQ